MLANDTSTHIRRVLLMDHADRARIRPVLRMLLDVTDQPSGAIPKNSTYHPPPPSKNVADQSLLMNGI